MASMPLGRHLLPEDEVAPMVDARLSEIAEKEPSIVEGNGPVTGHIISTTIGGKNGEAKQTVSYMAERVVGSGSFGIVFQAKCLETGETVAIKKVLQDRRYKNRELQLMRSMDHPNVVSLKHCFFSTTNKDELFLNLVMEYIPEALYLVLKHYSNVNQRMPLIYVKLYMYQIFRGLAYIHAVPGVCHRDVKPQNLLVDPLTHQIKLCDFGSAKVLLEACAHSFFDELREPNARLPNGRLFPPLFNFKQESAAASPELISKLIPEHVRRQAGLSFLHPAAT